MKSAAIREAFLRYFNQQDHTIVVSSPLIPANDPSLLFTNAGMVQFKDTFLGKESRGYCRATSSQRCVRAGGKHNDLENVGYTARHHTFFEMLGNFSFGDYFKREAIQYAWHFLTKELGLPEERLWITVYEDDQEAESIWLDEMQVSKARFSRCGAKDNFWSMGDTGPCGPCSEIFYDHGPEVAGGPPGTPEEEGDRYIEIWNLVFMQFNREPNGDLKPLPKPSVDTGMGLERIAAVLQGVHNNYDIDLFQALITAAAEILQREETSDTSLRVIADHIRACAFLIVDGVRPSNEGRGYVLRRIIRRAVRHGNKLGMQQPFFYRLVAPLVQEMGLAYPELATQQLTVEQTLRQEEEQFSQTLAQGMKVLESEFSALTGPIIPGEIVFKLYDTYGFPVDLTADIARERDLRIDQEGFESAMERQRQQSRAGSQFAPNCSADLAVSGNTLFTGYEKLRGESTVVALFQAGNPVMVLEAGQEGTVVLEQTPFYAEAGGQAGDKGVLMTENTRFTVSDTTKQERVFLHHGQVEHGKLVIGQFINAVVAEDVRQATRLNHSATHLLHAALREVLGEHVVQKGSLVNEQKFRFDFSHFQAVTAEEIKRIEERVNAQIRHNSQVMTRIMNIDEAKQAGAMALFGEKYDDTVRVLSMGGNYSVELCGGTHVTMTGDIGFFKIIQETAIAAGIRRLEGVTGHGAMAWLNGQEALLAELGESLKSSRAELRQKVQHLLQQYKEQERELLSVKTQLAQRAGLDLVQQAKTIGEAKVIVAKLDEVDAKTLRTVVESLKALLPNAVICLAAINGAKVNLVSGVTGFCLQHVHAGELVHEAAQELGGKGGGRKDMAQAGGPDIQNLKPALLAVETWIDKRMPLS